MRLPYGLVMLPSCAAKPCEAHAKSVPAIPMFVARPCAAQAQKATLYATQTESASAMPCAEEAVMLLTGTALMRYAMTLT